jgi:predicted AAA+ superfamily ATPase
MSKGRNEIRRLDQRIPEFERASLPELERGGKLRHAAIDPPTENSRFVRIEASMEFYVIAGPNGAGKTTFARKFLPNYAKCKNFVNADLIAARMSPFSPETAAVRAGRLMLDEIRFFSEHTPGFVRF